MSNSMPVVTESVFDQQSCGRGIGTVFLREYLKNLLPGFVLWFQTEQNINYRVSDLFVCSGLVHLFFAPLFTILPQPGQGWPKSPRKHFAPRRPSLPPPPPGRYKNCR